MVSMRFVFHTKWNHAQPVIDAFMTTRAIIKRQMGADMRLLSDLTGPMHTIVEEIDIESIGQWESSRAELMGIPEFRQAVESVSQYIESGSLEFYTIEA